MHPPARRCGASDAMVLVSALLTCPFTASAQLKVLISGGFSGPYEKLLPDFERTTGTKVATASASAAAVVAGSKEIEAAKRWIAFLASEHAATTIRSGGMEPPVKRHGT